MVEIVRRKKALSVSPLKASQPVGASLAFLGLSGAMPLMHGSQGCTAFAKVFFVRHFREPIPLQTTAMDQVSSVMGADDNIVQALTALCSKTKPRVIGLVSTGLSEMQGCDLRGAVKEFRRAQPEHDDVTVVAVNTPDFSGCFETGYASAVLELLKATVPNTTQERHEKELNVLAGSMLTPGDLEELTDVIDQFGLRCRIVPNLSESLGGELTQQDFSATTVGGTSVSELPKLGQAAATLVIGESLKASGRWLEKQTGVPSHYLPHLHTLKRVDELVALLLKLSQNPIPQKLVRQRRQLTDAMLDTHFMLGQRRVAIATDPDLLLAMTELSQSMGMEVVSAVAPAKGPALDSLALQSVKLGDLEDLEKQAKEHAAQLLLSNSHAAETAHRLRLPLVRMGFPLYDTIGAYQRNWVGYRGVKHTLFDLANIIASEQLDEVEAYRSEWSQKSEQEVALAQS